MAARLFQAPESYFEKLHNLLFCTYDSLAIHRVDSILTDIRFMLNLYAFIFGDKFKITKRNFQENLQFRRCCYHNE